MPRARICAEFTELFFVIPDCECGENATRVSERTDAVIGLYERETRDEARRAEDGREKPHWLLGFGDAARGGERRWDDQRRKDGTTPFLQFHMA